MQYNKWQSDPLSLGSPGNAIASRFDLLPASLGIASPFGATDAKVWVMAECVWLSICVCACFLPGNGIASRFDSLPASIVQSPLSVQQTPRCG